MDFPLGPNESERLQALIETNLLDGKPDTALDALCSDARAHFDVPIALVTLLDDVRQHFRGRSGTEETETPRNQAFCNYTILSDDIFVVPDALEDPRFVHNPLVTGQPFIRFYAGAPLTYLKDIRLGALCLLDRRPRSFSLGDRAELAEMADRAVAVIAARSFPERPSLEVP